MSLHPPFLTDAQRRARALAIEAGSAVEASVAFNAYRPYGEAFGGPLDLALYDLSSVETGSELAELEFICANPAGVHPDWIARRDAAKVRRDQWRHELAVAKAAQAERVAA